MIFIISGPSGSGKTTLLQYLIRDKELKNLLKRSISFATRAKRFGEKEKKDYFFITEEEFRERLRRKKILEWTRYLGYYYGTPKDYVEKNLSKGKHLALCLDFRGAAKIKRLYPKDTVTIFIMPPSLEALKERIEKRCNKTKKEEVLKRLKLASQELAVAEKYDYCLVNKELDKTARELKKIISKEITRLL